jgi:two-component system, OmpR family, response regulator RegX3
MRIALLEEDMHTANQFAGWLQSAGHEAVVHDAAEVFMRDVPRGASDVLVIGHHTAGLRGEDLVSWVREQAGLSKPVLRICTNNNEMDIVAALNAGADDCMVKPPRRLEFLARIEALGRRVPRPPKQMDVLVYGDLSVDLQNRVILRDGQRIALTPKSYDLAVFLFSNVGQLLSRSYLMERIWGRGSSSSTRTLDTHISRLRTDLGLTPENGWILQSVYQHGYRLEKSDPRPARLHVWEAERPSC